MNSKWKKLVLVCLVYMAMTSCSGLSENVIAAPEELSVNKMTNAKEITVQSTANSVNSSDNCIKRLKSSYLVGDLISFTLKGAGVSKPEAGSERYVPIEYAVGSSVFAVQPSGTSPSGYAQTVQKMIRINAAGTYTMEVIFQKQRYNVEKGRWENVKGSTDVKKKSIRVKSLSTPTPKPSTSAAASYVVTSGNLKYKIQTSSSKRVAYLIGCTDKNSLTGLTVKSTITVNKKQYDIISVSANAFSGCSRLKKVILGNNIEYVGTKAFANCAKLSAVTIGTGVKSFGYDTFMNDKSLRSIVIKSKKLEKVNSNVIYGIQKKAVIKVPYGKVRAYKKLFKDSTGFKSSMKIKWI